MTSTDDLAQALQTLLRRVKGRVGAFDEARDGDVAVGWSGGLTVYVRLLPGTATEGALGAEPATAADDLSDGLDRPIGQVEHELGGGLDVLRRAGKQRAVRLLKERGAFEMRRSTDTVAEALGVAPVHRLRLFEPGGDVLGMTADAHPSKYIQQTVDDFWTSI